MRKQLIESISSVLFGAGACAFFVAFTMALRFYAVGSSVPDPSTGRTFPFGMHGILYVKAEQAEWVYGLMVAAAVCGIASFLISHGRQRWK
jgi:hypothetical protein